MWTPTPPRPCATAFAASPRCCCSRAARSPSRSSATFPRTPSTDPSSSCSRKVCLDPKKRPAGKVQSGVSLRLKCYPQHGMLEWMLFRAIMVAVFILANSFFVAAEFALISVRETRMQQLLALGRPGARTALHLKQNIDDFLPAVQFGVTLAALALGWLGEPAVAEMLLALAAGVLTVLPAHAVLYAHTVAVILAFAIISYFEVLLGELVPKALALQRAERIALAIAGPMDVFIRMTRPDRKSTRLNSSH